MTGGIGKVVVNADALSVLVEDVGDATGKEAEGGLGDLEGLADLIVLVGKDREVEAKFGGELLLRLDVLARNSNNVYNVFVKKWQAKKILVSAAFFQIICRPPATCSYM